MKAWRLALLIFLLGLGLGLSVHSLFSPAHSQGNDVVFLLRSIDRRLESIERRLERMERNVDNLNRNFDYVRDWNTIRVKVVK
ncbi:MAG: hypothetical protein NZ937_07475 [Armatimonadetes bacterium]|nr:hypothetical protein [Armatimonadota bacterium]